MLCGWEVTIGQAESSGSIPLGGFMAKPHADLLCVNWDATYKLSVCVVYFESDCRVRIDVNDFRGCYC